MSSNLSCAQVSALLSDYIEDKLNDDLKQFVCAHLQICPTCRAKYDALKDMLESLEQIKDKLEDLKPIKISSELEKQDFELEKSISAYVDNELSDDENLRVKRNIISNPLAREKFEKVNTLRKLLYNNFEKTKNEAKFDYTKDVMSRLDIREEVYNDFSFVRVVAIFIILIALCTISAVIIFSV